MRHCHSLECGEHFGANKTTTNVLQLGFFCPTLYKDVHAFVSAGERCQRMGNMFRRDELPLMGILEVELFYVWGIDFMRPLPSSCNHKYILLAIDYVSKWVEAIPTQTNDAKVVLNFLRMNIFTRFRTPRAIISDEGSHLCNKMMEKLLQRYGV